MIGKTISHYKIFEKLGQGGMGIVYKAQDTKLDRIVALKLLPPHLLSSEEEKARFVHEAKASASIDHPNVCTVYEIGEHEKNTFISMAYIEGQSLKDKITERPLKLEETLDIAIQVAAGLQKAHEKQIIHRDIKPANILISNEGIAKIVDFGLAKLSGKTKLTKDSSTLGTAAYMSPEQTRGEEVDSRTDVWSLGVVLYECIAGKLPFRGDYEQAMQYSIVNEQPEPLTGLRTGIPLELERIVNKALVKNSDERYQHVDEMLVDLKKVQKDLDSKVDAERRPIVAAEKKRSRRLLKRIVIPISIVLAFVLAIFLIRSFVFEEVIDSDPTAIAILPFNNMTGDEKYDILKYTIPNLMITKLENSKYLQVITWEQLRDILKKIGKDSVEILNIDKDTGFELCRLSGINVAVIGGLSKVGNTFAVDVQVLDVRTKKLLKGANSQGYSEDSILKNQIDELCNDIAEGVGLSQNKIETIQQPIEELTTQSMEAYQLYQRGMNEFYRYFPKEGIRYLKLAIELDSTFTLAYIRLAFVLGATDEGKEAIKKAKRFYNNANNKDKLYIDQYDALYIEKDKVKFYQITRYITENYPNEKDAWRDLLSYYFYRGLYREALEAGLNAYKIDPNFLLTNLTLGYTYSYLEEYDNSLKYLKKCTSIAPGDPNPINSIGEVYFKWGKIDEAIKKFKETQKVQPEFGNIFLVYAYALIGNYDEVENWMNKEIITSQSRERSLNIYSGFILYWLGNIEQAQEKLIENLSVNNEDPYSYWLRGWIYYYMSKYKDSQKNFNIWYKIKKKNHPKLRIYSRSSIAWYEVLLNYYSGLNDLKLGSIDSAEDKMNKMKVYIQQIEHSNRKKMSRYYFDLLLGEIFLAEKSPEKVITLLKNSSPLDFGLIWIPLLRGANSIPIPKDVLARAYYQNGELDNAIIEYEKLTTFEPNKKSRDLINPKYHYLLAKLYEEKGDTQKAILKYQKFLDIWKNADDDLLEKIDAQKRLANLK